MRLPQLCSSSKCRLNLEIFRIRCSSCRTAAGTISLQFLLRSDCSLLLSCLIALNHPSAIQLRAVLPAVSQCSVIAVLPTASRCSVAAVLPAVRRCYYGCFTAVSRCSVSAVFPAVRRCYYCCSYCSKSMPSYGGSSCSKTTPLWLFLLQ
jgi:hypothetical protein